MKRIALVAALLALALTACGKKAEAPAVVVVPTPTVVVTPAPAPVAAPETAPAAPAAADTMKK